MSLHFWYGKSWLFGRNTNTKWFHSFCKNFLPKSWAKMDMTLTWAFFQIDGQQKHHQEKQSWWCWITLRESKKQHNQPVAQPVAQLCNGLAEDQWNFTFLILALILYISPVVKTSDFYMIDMFPVNSTPQIAVVIRRIRLKQLETLCYEHFHLQHGHFPHPFSPGSVPFFLVRWNKNTQGSNEFILFGEFIHPEDFFSGLTSWAHFFLVRDLLREVGSGLDQQQFLVGDIWISTEC